MTKRFARRATAIAVGLLLVGSLSSSAFASPKNQMKVFFLNSGVQAQATGKLLFVTNRAQTFFMINVQRMTPGSYDIVLNSAIVDTITVNGSGEGRVLHRFRVNPRHADPPLSYDPRGGELEIQATGTTLLMASVPSDPAVAQQKTLIQIDLTNMAAQVGATANATLTARFGRMKFEVEVHGAVTGTYDLLVDGVKVADIAVNSNGFGEVQFDSRPSTDEDDDGLDLLLTFDPRGKDVSIMLGVVPQFEGSFPLQ